MATTVLAGLALDTAAKNQALDTGAINQFSSERVSLAS